jgi:hypothetical protein
MGKVERGAVMKDPVEIRFRAPTKLRDDLLKYARRPRELSALMRGLLEHGVKDRDLVQSIITSLRNSSSPRRPQR